MTDGQQRDEPQGSDEEFRPKPGQPTLPFRAITPPPSAADPQQQQQQQPGYGYPPQQPGYGYPQQQRPQPFQQPPADPPAQAAGPAWAPPAAHIGEGAFPQRTGAAEPDWSALAERGEQDGRRRRLFLIGGGSLAVLVVAGIVATAVIVSGHHKTPAPGPTASHPAGESSHTFPAVTPPPPADPLAILSSSTRDTAPLTADGLFPGRTLNYGSRHYTKAVVDSTASCASAVSVSLGAVLDHNGCHRMLRATYYGDGVAVTVGVAVFDSKADATNAKAQAGPYVLPLSGGGLGPFCHGSQCQVSVNSVGRYAYFTIAGRTDNLDVSETDTVTRQSAQDVADLAFNSIVQRGREEAATATASPNG